MVDIDAERFRREVRRLASRYLSGKLTHVLFLAEVRKASVTCGIGESGRRSRDDRLLDALAWGSGSIPPGELPARLEPLFDRYADASLGDDEFVAAVRDVVAQVRKPMTSSAG